MPAGPEIAIHVIGLMSKPKFLEGRHLRVVGEALVGANRERAQRAAVDMAHHRRGGQRPDIDVPEMMSPSIGPL